MTFCGLRRWEGQGRLHGKRCCWNWDLKCESNLRKEKEGHHRKMRERRPRCCSSCPHRDHVGPCSCALFLDKDVQPAASMGQVKECELILDSSPSLLFHP